MPWEKPSLIILKIPRRNKLPNKNKFHLLISFLILIICQEIFHVYIPNSCTTSLEAFCLCICLNVGICSLILKICLAGCGRLATFHLLVGRDSCLFRWYALSNLNSFTLIPPYNIIPSSLNGKCNNCQTNRSAVLLFVLSPSKKKYKTPGNSRIFLVLLFVSLSVLLCFKQDLSSSLKLCCVVFVHLFPCFLENFNDECLTGAKNVLVFSRFRWVFCRLLEFWSRQRQLKTTKKKWEKVLSCRFCCWRQRSWWLLYFFLLLLFIPHVFKFYADGWLGRRLKFESLNFDVRFLFFWCRCIQGREKGNKI